jgi:hypothetical protein
MRTVFTALCLASFLAAAEEGAPANAPKLAVLPFASLSGDVPARAGTKTSNMLMTEFKNADGLQWIDLRKADAPNPGADALNDVRKNVDEAKELRKKKKFRLASEALQKAVAGYKQNAAGVNDVAEVVDTYALLSAVQYNTGRDDEGQKSLAAALALAPDRDLPLAATSQLFARVVTDARNALKAAPKGTLQIETSPSGAAVVVDGIALGNSPLQVKEVPPGLHF